MKNVWFVGFLMLFLGLNVAHGQAGKTSIREMRWGNDFKLHVDLSNDSNYVMDVRALYHAEDFDQGTSAGETTYYPVNLDEDFIDYIKSRRLEIEKDSAENKTIEGTPTTLWSALHYTLGGGYVHFVNTLIYALESRQLSLYDPIMTRPVTTWKPKPKTKTWKRTHKWEHYIPSDQKLAQQEYKLRVKEKNLHDLQGVPQRFIDLFFSTTQQQYEEMQQMGRTTDLAQIDLVRLLLGAKYLGRDQIDFIQARVLTSVLRYSVSTLPSVIIFESYNAAVAMTLDASGYKIDHVVFSDENAVPDHELDERLEKIRALIVAINEANDEVFKKKLSVYYGS